MLTHALFFPFSLPLPTPIDRVCPKRCLKARHEADSFEPPSGLSDYHLGGRAGWALLPQDRATFSPLSSLFSFSYFNVNILPLHINFLSFPNAKLQQNQRWSSRKIDDDQNRHAQPNSGESGRYRHHICSSKRLEFPTYR